MEPHGQGPSSTLRHAQPRERPVEAVRHRDEREAEGDEPRGEVCALATPERTRTTPATLPSAGARRRAPRVACQAARRGPQPVDGQTA